MFLSFIPVWLACCLFYCTSKRQTLLKKPLAALPYRVIATILLSVMLLQLFKYLPTVSALVTGLSLMCCFLTLITLISAYEKYYLLLTSALVCVLSIAFSMIGINV
ncbi:MAG: hypothetical protein ACI9LM_002585 [Alteromonadaceae bacterium]|jgi:hypothetical protein